MDGRLPDNDCASVKSVLEAGVWKDETITKLNERKPRISEARRCRLHADREVPRGPLLLQTTRCPDSSQDYTFKAFNVGRMALMMSSATTPVDLARPMPPLAINRAPSMTYLSYSSGKTHQSLHYAVTRNHNGARSLSGCCNTKSISCSYTAWRQTIALYPTSFVQSLALITLKQPSFHLKHIVHCANPRVPTRRSHVFLPQLL